MLIRQTLRTFEKHCIRSMGRLLKRSVRGMQRSNDEVVLLEQRVAALEPLVRELTTASGN